MNSGFYITGLVTLFIAFISGTIAVSIWGGRVQEHKKGVTEFMKEIRDDIKKIFDRLPPNPVGAGSPMKLTELGEEISKEISAKQWAIRTAESLVGKIEGKKEFEVYDFCVKYVNEDFQPTEEQNDMLRESAYEHGIKNEQVLGVLAVELRDALLKLAGES